MTNNYTIEKRTNDPMGSKSHWSINFCKEPSDDEITDIVEKMYPSPGYGASITSKPILNEGGFWVVFVQSNKSCE